MAGGPIRVGVVGCGEIAQIMHLRFLDELPEFEIVALCDLSETVLATLGERYRVPHLLTDHTQLAEIPDVDAVAVCTPDHVGPVLAALGAGKHVLCEKPLAFDEQDAQELADAARRASVVAMVGYMRLFDPAYEYLSARVGRLAPIRLVEIHDFMARFDKHASLFELVTPTRAEMADSSARVIDEWSRGPLERAVGDDVGAQELYRHVLLGASHDVSMLRGVFGPPSNVLFATSEAQGRLIGCLSFEKSVRALLAVDTLASYEWWEQRMTVYGAAEALTLGVANPYIPYVPSRLTRRAGEGEHEVDSDVIVSYESPFRREWRHFAECIREGAPVRSSFDAAVGDVAALAELVRSAYRPSSVGVPALARGDRTSSHGA
jgi:predicted dehydrogenase